MTVPPLFDAANLPKSETDDNYVYRYLATLKSETSSISDQMALNNRTQIEAWWQKHYDKLDGEHSRQMAKTHFYSVWWELYLAEFLEQRGFVFEPRQKGGGPDFICTHPSTGQQRYVIEAVSATAGDKNNAPLSYKDLWDASNSQKIVDSLLHPDKYSEPILPKVVSMSRGNVSLDKPVLRITSSLLKKFEKLVNYLNKSIINKQDCVLIACHTGFDTPLGIKGKSLFSSFHEAVFSLELSGVEWSGNDFENAQHFIESEGELTNPNGATVYKDFFLQEKSAFISGLLYSDVNYCNHKPIGLIHNPMANLPLPESHPFNIDPCPNDTLYGEWECEQFPAENKWELRPVYR